MKRGRRRLIRVSEPGAAIEVDVYPLTPEERAALTVPWPMRPPVERRPTWWERARAWLAGRLS